MSREDYCGKLSADDQPSRAQMRMEVQVECSPECCKKLDVDVSVAYRNVQLSDVKAERSDT